MENQYPLFPRLDDEGQTHAQELVDKFKEKMKKAADEVLGELYCDVAVHIESDSWSNFRNELMDGFRNYRNRHIQNKYDFAEIRKQIFKEFREEIIQDLNQDYLAEIESLKKELSESRQYARQLSERLSHSH